MAKEIFSKDPHLFNAALAAALEKVPEFKAPQWSFFVRTGISKQRTPTQENFWQIRTASILRQLYLNGVVGVERLRTRYGGRKNRGARPAKFKKSSGKIIRVILQQAEQAGLVEKVTGAQFGRRLTQKGRDFLDSINVAQVQETALSDLIAKSKQIEVEQEEFQEENLTEEQDGQEA